MISTTTSMTLSNRTQPRGKSQQFIKTGLSKSTTGKGPKTLITCSQTDQFSFFLLSIA